ncbi:flagellar hook-basal body complex protein FliE [Ferrimonas senticii]|uniref:flagellar hook-basal body complex protein FliE n=1 Tax=Ferrimonas senticii TaxID=394566 RepID=UPI0004068622|nr:flagellar hook-basal body complex protein FliE [Ferrimonas senticii]
MQVTNHSMLAEMNAMALEASGNPNALTPSNPVGSDFGELLSAAINNVNQLQGTSSELATRFELGDPKVSLGDTMIAKEKAGVAFEATVQVRNKLVEAYKEIMSMPV